VGGPPQTLWNGNSRGVGGYGYFLETHNVNAVI